MMHRVVIGQGQKWLFGLAPRPSFVLSVRQTVIFAPASRTAQNYISEIWCRESVHLMRSGRDASQRLAVEPQDHQTIAGGVY